MHGVVAHALAKEKGPKEGRFGKRPFLMPPAVNFGPRPGRKEDPAEKKKKKRNRCIEESVTAAVNGSCVNFGCHRRRLLPREGVHSLCFATHAPPPPLFSGRLSMSTISS
ncbi:hypothetical protein L249_2442 [Ophiocordyceps polyrhachis-furcata BCC 54312]|uniref:Uncharacterized protein n=1 Tax=Ophiocordyceps polyrhachis-furcata BCC 54312 TaxID=1330021 RepID=A0A367LS12_9HYPO|nr:hypothetical protein L249_2442 [Ophiocordyceps polyrhachis-furcata BCC 54312]